MRPACLTWCAHKSAGELADVDQQLWDGTWGAAFLMSSHVAILLTILSSRILFGLFSIASHFPNPAIPFLHQGTSSCPTSAQNRGLAQYNLTLTGLCLYPLLACKVQTVMLCITMSWSRTDCIYDSGPWDYNGAENILWPSDVVQVKPTSALSEPSAAPQ